MAEQYLAELERAAAALPAGRRAELVSDIRSHITVARAESPADTPSGTGGDAGVREILALLGDPQGIVAAALLEQPAGAPTGAASRSGSGMREGFALVLLLLGGLLFWFVPLFSWIGWIIGLVLLCLSRRWTVGDKLLGAVGVALAPVLLTGSVTLAAGSESCTGDAATPAVPGGQGTQPPAIVCTTTSTMPPALAIALAVALLGAMVFAASRLARRAGRLNPSPL